MSTDQPTGTIRATFAVYDWPNNVCGPASWAERLLPGLQEHGLEVSCLALCWGESGPLVSNLRRAGVVVSDTICVGTSEDRVRWILGEVGRLKPHVFVPNLVVPAMYASRWIRESGISTVGVLHSDDPFYQGVLDVFGAGKRHDALSAFASVSEELHRQAQRRISRESESICIPCGVPIPPEMPKRSGDFQFGYVGRLSEVQKRISDVTRVMCRTVREVESTSGYIFGDGPDRKNVEHILASEGAGLPVSLIGRVGPDEIQSHLQQMDAILLLSDYEGLPIALMEAMACGVVPVVCSMKSGIPELVRHGETGWIVNDRGESVVEAIRTLRDDKSQRTRLSRNARELIRHKFSHDVSVEGWERLLLRLASRSRVGRLQIPSKVTLPPVHPALAAEDQRERQVPLHSALLRALGDTVRRVLPGVRKSDFTSTNEQ